MLDQYFGVKELYEVSLKAKTPMKFGSRYIEAGEPVLYFENINMAVLGERSNTILARGGWENMPRVIWEDRSEVQFSFTEGVMSNISMSILLSANVTETSQRTDTVLIPKREGPYSLEDNCLYVEHLPVTDNGIKGFIFQYERDVAQKKVYGELKPDMNNYNSFLDETSYCIRVYDDKEHQHDADATKQYIVDYYYEYSKEALFYTIQKERFNGLFTLEGKFYSKDENEGLNYTNLIYMPKVRVVSDINLRLGERADPAVSAFTIIGLPENIRGKKGLILEITHLGEDIDEM